MSTSTPVVLTSPRRWPYVVAGLAAGLVFAAAAATLLPFDDDDSAAAASDHVELSTAPVEQRDLVEEVEWVADLTYGTSIDVAAPGDGTVTAAAAAGAVLRRGDAVVEIDELPVTVMYGSVPAWRDLRDDDEGADVLQLETNLVALGFDPDGDVRVDTEFDGDTEDMVEAWQESLGLEETGVFAAEDVVIVDGPVAVVTSPAVGTPVRSGDALAQVSARAVVTTAVPVDATGVVTDIAEVGTPVEHGTLLFTVDDTEVRAVQGFDPIEDIDLDDGVEREFVLVDLDTQVSALLVTDGADLDLPRPVLELSRQTLSVVIPVGLADQDEWSVDQAVEIVLPDETSVAGRVIDVGTVAQGTGQGETPTIDVEVEVVDLVDDDLPASEVTVVVAGESILGATVVPTRALVTLAEGGFAVEVVNAEATTLVGVETGTFDDGVVEVIDSTLSVGDLLVVPS